VFSFDERRLEYISRISRSDRTTKDAGVYSTFNQRITFQRAEIGRREKQHSDLFAFDFCRRLNHY
jgi:hypothetical protein